MRLGLPLTGSRRFRGRSGIAAVAVAAAVGALSVPVAATSVDAAPATVTDLSHGFEDGATPGGTNGVRQMPFAEERRVEVLAIKVTRPVGEPPSWICLGRAGRGQYTLSAYVRMAPARAT